MVRPTEMVRKLRRGVPQPPTYKVAHDERRPLPVGAAEYLRPDNPRLLELRSTYAGLNWPVTVPSRWGQRMLDDWLHLAWFRGDNPYIWQYRLLDPQAQNFKYFIFLRHVLDIDSLGLVEKLGEDGAFGCWLFEYAGYPLCSRDLLDSVLELTFLDRHWQILRTPGLRVLDIGAGYGRLAYRWSQAAPSLADYCCTDAIAESTFLSEYYAQYRQVVPPVRVAPLHTVPDLPVGGFDIAVNVHSFSECTRDAIAWWVHQLRRLEVPRLFLVPNESNGICSTEPDGRRLDVTDVLNDAGFRLVHEEPVFADAAVRQMLEVDDRFCLYEL
jgi:SAM-dependent methyltransferase